MLPKYSKYHCDTVEHSHVSSNKQLTSSWIIPSSTVEEVSREEAQKCRQGETPRAARVGEENRRGFGRAEGANADGEGDKRSNAVNITSTREPTKANGGL